MGILVSAYILCLDYLHFYKIKYSKNVNWSMLRLTKMALFVINLTVIFKWFSFLLPRSYLLELLTGFEENHCFCAEYWSMSLLLYVSGFYLLKLMFFKKVFIMTQNPMLGNERAIKTIPKTINGILVGQFFAYTVCQVMMINMTASQCTDEALTEYDAKSKYCCHDTFDSMDIWFALSAIVADFALFTSFCNKWYRMFFVLMEDIAASFLIQFSLVVIGMLSCTINATFHIILLYKSKSGEFDSFRGTAPFCLDCAVMATCLCLTLTDFQAFIAKKLGVQALIAYYEKLRKIEYSGSLLC